MRGCCKDSAVAAERGEGGTPCPQNGSQDADTGSKTESEIGFTVDGEKIKKWLNQKDPPIESEAFGTIDFCNNYAHKSPYIKIQDKAEPEHLYKFMKEHWHLPQPTIIISIVGDASKLQVSLEELGARYTTRSISTEGAWIITDGLCTSSEDTACEEPMGFASNNRIPIIGVAPWNSITKREELERSEENEERRKENKAKEAKELPVCYRSLEMESDRTQQPLNPNRSHFILVDGDTSDIHQGWRSKFEGYLAKQRIDGNDDEPTTKIPVVTLRVNAQKDRFKVATRILSMEPPPPPVAVVGLESEGGAIATNRVGPKKQLPPTDAQSSTPPPVPDGDILSQPQLYSDMITISHCEYSSSKPVEFNHSTPRLQSLDKAIHSLLKTKLKLEDQMRLAIAWNRVDIAREDVLNPWHLYKQFLTKGESGNRFFYDIAIKVLLDDKPEFMELLLTNGLNLKRFVEIEAEGEGKAVRLQQLYDQARKAGSPYANFADGLLRKKEEEKKRQKTLNCTDLNIVGSVLKALVGHTWVNNYKHYSGVDGEHENLDNYLQKDPAQHLMFWAVLFNRMEMAKLLWRYSQDHIAGAIIVGAIMRRLSMKSVYKGEDVKQAFDANSKEFEKMAVGILELCWSKDRDLTSMMLRRKCSNWGGVDVISMAFDAKMKRFISQPASHTTLCMIWRGDISVRTPWYWILLFALCPLFALKLHIVRQEEDSQSFEDRKGKNQCDRKVRWGNGDTINFFTAIWKAWNSPIVKCTHHFLMFLAFLMAYSVFLMTQLKPYTSPLPLNSTNNTSTCYICCPEWRIGCLEIAIYCYLVSHAVEEIRQIHVKNYMPFRKYGWLKLKQWLRSFWNGVDSAAGIMFVFAVVLRFILDGEYYKETRWLYSFSFICYATRFAQLFFVTPALGPKIIMIKKMLVDMMFFLTVMLIAILIFGVASQAILHPESELEWSLVGEVIYKPYFQMYGELFLEDYQGHQWILLGFYMVISTVLLLNLLIAMFSYTFQQVQEQSAILAKFYFCELVFEHRDRPWLPLFGAFWQMFKRCCCPDYSITCCCSKSPKPDGKALKDARITSFVTVCMEEYMAKESTSQKHESNKTEQILQMLQMCWRELQHPKWDKIINKESVDSSTN